MSETLKLYRLQQIDSLLDRNNKRLIEIETILNDDLKLKKAQADADSATIKLREAQKKQRTAEANTKAQRLKIEQTEARLFSGKVRNPKVLQDLQNESAALKRYLDVLEERQIEAMLATDEAESAFQAAQQALERAQATRIEMRAALNGEKTRLLKEVTQLENERNAAIQIIPPDNLAMYEKLRTRLGGVAVATVREKSCSACGNQLNSALLQAAHSPNQITRCDTCKRILYAT